MTSAPTRSTAGTAVPASVVAGLGGLAAVANVGLLPRGLWPGPVSWLSGAAAAAAGSSAVLLAVAAALVCATLRGTRRAYGRLLAASLAAFGVATLGRLSLAASCPGGLGCSVAGAPAQLQRWSGALATVGTVLGCVVLVRLRASRPARGEVFGEATLAVAVTVLAALQASSYLAGMPAGTDWVRRGQVVAVSAWLVLTGFLLARLTGGPAWRVGVALSGVTVRATVVREAASLREPASPRDPASLREPAATVPEPPVVVLPPAPAGR